MPLDIVDRRLPDQIPPPPPIDLEDVGLFGAPPKRNLTGDRTVNTPAPPPLNDRISVDDQSRQALRGFERKRYGAQFEQAYENAIDTNFQYRSENLVEATKMAAQTGKPLVMVFSDIRNTALTPQDGLIGREKSLVGGQAAANEKAIYVFCDLDSVREKIARGEDPPEAKLLKSADVGERPLRAEDGIFHPSIVVFGVRNDGTPSRMDVFQDTRHEPIELKNSIDRVKARDDEERRRQIVVSPPPTESDLAPPLPEEFEPPPSANSFSAATNSDAAAPNPPAREADELSSVAPPIPSPEPAEPPILEAGDVPLPPIPSPNLSSPPQPKEPITPPRVPKADDVPPPMPVPAELPPLPESPAAVEPTSLTALTPEAAREDFRRQVEEERQKYNSLSQAIDLFYGNSAGTEKSFVSIQREFSQALKNFESSVFASSDETEEQDFERSKILLQNAAEQFQNEQKLARAVEEKLRGLDLTGADSLRRQVEEQRQNEYRRWRDNEALAAFVDKYRDRLDLDGDDLRDFGIERLETRTP